MSDLVDMLRLFQLAMYSLSLVALCVAAFHLHKANKALRGDKD